MHLFNDFSFVAFLEPRLGRDANVQQINQKYLTEDSSGDVLLPSFVSVENGVRDMRLIALELLLK